MEFVKRSVLCLILVGLFMPRGALAQSQASPAEIKAFVSEYVGAFNAKDVARFHALYYPESLACITRESKDYYDGLTAVQWRDPIPATYTFAVGAVNETNMKALESLARLPVKPTQQLQIDYQIGDDSGSLILLLVRENGRVYNVVPCATELALKQFRDNAPAVARFNAEHKALAAAIQEPLRSQLMALLRQHKTGEATDRYRKASGQDMKTSMFVIDVLAHEGRQ